MFQRLKNEKIIMEMKKMSNSGCNEGPNSLTEYEIGFSNGKAAGRRELRKELEIDAAATSLTERVEELERFVHSTYADMMSLLAERMNQIGSPKPVSRRSSPPPTVPEFLLARSRARRAALELKNDDVISGPGIPMRPSGDKRVEEMCEKAKDQVAELRSMIANL